MTVLLQCGMKLPGWLGQQLGVSTRAWKEICRETMAEVGRHWFESFLRLHFREGAAARYGYQPRTAKYIRSKIKAAKKGKALAGGVVPLLYTGDLREEVQGYVYVRAFPTRATLTLHGPKYLSMTPRGSRPNMGQEITAVSDEERFQMAALMADRLGAKMDALGLDAVTEVIA
jgi:hypothetical protein